MIIISSLDTMFSVIDWIFNCLSVYSINWKFSLEIISQASFYKTCYKDIEQ